MGQIKNIKLHIVTDIKRHTIVEELDNLSSRRWPSQRTTLLTTKVSKLIETGSRNLDVTNIPHSKELTPNSSGTSGSPRSTTSDSGRCSCVWYDDVVEGDVLLEGWTCHF